MTVAPETGDVARFCVDDDWDATFARGFDHALDESRYQDVLGVVREHDRRNLVCRIAQPLADHIDLVRPDLQASLNVETHDLVAARNITDLRRGGMVVHSDEAAHHTIFVNQGTGDQVALRVVP